MSEKTYHILMQGFAVNITNYVNNNWKTSQRTTILNSPTSKNLLFTNQETVKCKSKRWPTDVSYRMVIGWNPDSLEEVEAKRNIPACRCKKSTINLYKLYRIKQPEPRILHEMKV